MKIAEAVRQQDQLERVRIWLEKHPAEVFRLREIADAFGFIATTAQGILRRLPATHRLSAKLGQSKTIYGSPKAIKTFLAALDQRDA